MGDRRVYCNIEFTFLGPTETYKSSLNWPGNGEIHPAIIQWLKEQYNKGLEQLRDDAYDRQEREEEERERAQLTRLKAKYESNLQ